MNGGDHWAKVHRTEQRYLARTIMRLLPTVSDLGRNAL
jgi:hypothetical protein